MITIYIGDRKYQVEEAKTTKEKRDGLSNRKSLPKKEGMLFYFDKPQKVNFWMKDTTIPLDIVFIDDDEEVISVHEGKPLDQTLISEEGVKYVLEVNAKSGIKQGDDLEFEDDGDDSKYVMRVLAPDGSIQMNLEGGERIVSRRETKILIKKAKKAYKSKEDKDYKSLGKYMFKVLRIQDGRDPEYVEVPDSEND